jgi:diaminopimelate decarboxylase
VIKEYLKENIDQITTPAYYCNLSEFSVRALKVKEEFNSIPIAYSVKANPFLLSGIPECIDKVEVCSPGELNICLEMGIDPKKIIYSGVNKGIEDIETAISNKVGIISVESLKQLSMGQITAQKHGVKQRVILRLTSGNQFGMSEKDLVTALSSRDEYNDIVFYGIHYYAGTQKQLKQIEEDFQNLSDALDRVNTITGFWPDLVEMGPGLRVEYFGSDNREEMKYLKSVSGLINGFAKNYRVGIELGRYLAAACGVYATRVIDLKENNGIKYAICDGGTHHLKYYGQNLAMQVPKMEVVKSFRGADVYCICGSLCTTADVLVRKVELPELELDDVILFYQCGAYSVTEGMSLFLSRDLPEVNLFMPDHKLIRIRDSMATYKLNMAK